MNNIKCFYLKLLLTLFLFSRCKEINVSNYDKPTKNFISFDLIYAFLVKQGQEEAWHKMGNLDTYWAYVKNNKDKFLNALSIKGQKGKNQHQEGWKFLHLKALEVNWEDESAVKNFIKENFTPVIYIDPYGSSSMPIEFFFPTKINHTIIKPPLNKIFPIPNLEKISLENDTPFAFIESKHYKGFYIKKIYRKGKKNPFKRRNIRGKIIQIVPVFSYFQN